MLKVKVKTLEELMDTKGVSIEEGCLYIKNTTPEEDRVYFTPNMRYLCGREVYLNSINGVHSTKEEGWHIESWMCVSSEYAPYEEVLTHSLQTLGCQEVIDNEGRIVTIECNDNVLSTLIEEDNNIYLSIENGDGEMICAGLTFDQWEELNEQVEKIRKLKNEVMDCLEKGEINYEG